MSEFKLPRGLSHLRELSKSTIVILLDRLAQRDCLEDVLTDDVARLAGVTLSEHDPLLVTATQTALNAHCDDLAKWLRGDMLFFRRLSDVEKLILAECVEGSTWLACANSAHDSGDLTDAQLQAQYRAMRKVVAEVSSIVGRRVEHPAD